MNRIAISDGTGAWFDLDKSSRFREDTWWNGQNNISRATGSAHKHEDLYFTIGGKWVLNHYSQYSNELDVHKVISESQAVVWFLRQGMELPEQLEGKDEAYEI